MAAQRTGHEYVLCGFHEHELEGFEFGCCTERLTCRSWLLSMLMCHSWSGKAGCGS